MSHFSIISDSLLCLFANIFRVEGQLYYLNQIIWQNISNFLLSVSEHDSVQASMANFIEANSALNFWVE